MGEKVGGGTDLTRSIPSTISPNTTCLPVGVSVFRVWGLEKRVRDWVGVSRRICMWVMWDEGEGGISGKDAVVGGGRGQGEQSTVEPRGDYCGDEELRERGGA